MAGQNLSSTSEPADLQLAVNQLKVIGTWIAYWLKNDQRTIPGIMFYFMDDPDATLYRGPILIIPIDDQAGWGIDLDAHWWRVITPIQRVHSRPTWQVFEVSNIDMSQIESLVSGLLELISPVEVMTKRQWSHPTGAGHFDPRFHLELIVSELNRIKNSL